ncbi:MAG: nitroreductase family deazaflavin-dependent oxidoreductase [Actinomycetota bacterium]|nr:nitroreductase family deazaflavin-dependent oxidoreductase [Actinomycetota bacterium]
MVLSPRVARFNRLVTNRITLPVAGWLPGFGLVHHVGRRSGHAYRTPVNVFRSPGGYVVALTYGRDADWVKNVLAAGHCELVTRRRTHALTDPQVVRDGTRAGVPFVVRQILEANDVSDFLHLAERQP